MDVRIAGSMNRALAVRNVSIQTSSLLASQPPTLLQVLFARPCRRPARRAAPPTITHITLWTIQAAPLLIGADMAQFDPFTTARMTNHEVLVAAAGIWGPSTTGSRRRCRRMARC
jgi:hypothetical protein